MQSKKKLEKKFKLFSHVGPASSCNFQLESQNSSCHYRELQNQAQALMQAKKVKELKKIKLFSHIGPAASCRFKPESQNSSSRYRELHNQAQALMQSKNKLKKIQIFHTLLASCLLHAAASSHYYLGTIDIQYC
jgi:hypothetical protein